MIERRGARQPRRAMVAPERRHSGATALTALIAVLAMVVLGFYLFTEQGGEPDEDAARRRVALSSGGVVDPQRTAVGPGSEQNVIRD